MYADDACVNIALVNLIELLTALKNQLENISNWMRIKRLGSYTNKTEDLVIGHRRKLNRRVND